MNEYQVVWEGKVREVYYVEAETAEEARTNWVDYEPDRSEAIDGEVVYVTPIGEAI